MDTSRDSKMWECWGAVPWHQGLADPLTPNVGLKAAFDHCPSTGMSIYIYIYMHN